MPATGQTKETIAMHRFATVLAATLSGIPTEDTAKALGISKKRVEQIRCQPDFKAEIERICAEQVDAVRHRLRAAAEVAVNALIDVASNGKSESARVSAANSILGRIGVREGTDVSLDVPVDLRGKSDAELAEMAANLARNLAGQGEDAAANRRAQA